MSEISVILWEWLSFAIRWLHVIAGIAWIGSSFYFIALDLGLRKHQRLPEGVRGEEWQVHGGGFYHIQKYMVAPNQMPDDLIWFKWESYATWLSGFALLCVIYYAGADLYLLDPEVLDISAELGIAISLGSLGLGWVFYDLLCKSQLGKRDFALMGLLFVFLILASWGYAQTFSGRAALLHLGALTATIMSANVFLIIIPNQKIVVADLKAGRTPDAKYGIQAKQRSLHNNYLTLPVLFLMLSNHYPLAFASPYNWAIAALVFLMGVTIRHYFNTLHARAGNPLWTWALTALIFAAIVALSSVKPDYEWEEQTIAPRGAHQERLAASADFEEVVSVVQSRCSMCHAAEVGWDGIAVAPRGVILEAENDVLRHARDIYLQAGRTRAMPPANVTYIEPYERALLMRWYEAADQHAANGKSRLQN